MARNVKFVVFQIILPKYVSPAAALITPRPQINEGIGFSFDSYLSSQRTIFPKETFFLEKLSLEEHKMEISSTKIFALWEFFVNIFIISYYNNSKVFPFALRCSLLLIQNYRVCQRKMLKVKIFHENDCLLTVHDVHY